MYPGRPGSAPPLLAQHDWVHVLADYGTTVESELEVFAFIARANDDMRAFSLLAMVVSLFETGYLRTGAGLFEARPGTSRGARGDRVADAMRRGALVKGQRRLPRHRLVRSRTCPSRPPGPLWDRAQVHGAPSPPARSVRGSPAASASSSGRPDKKWRRPPRAPL